MMPTSFDAATWNPVAIALAAGPFDPAAWLSRADRLGFTFSVVSRGDRLALVWIEPEGEIAYRAEFALFSELAPDPDTRRRNRQALREHLLKIGRVGPPENFRT